MAAKMAAILDFTKNSDLSGKLGNCKYFFARHIKYDTIKRFAAFGCFLNRRKGETTLKLLKTAWANNEWSLFHQITNRMRQVTIIENCRIAHILGILLMNSYEIQICSEATFIWSLSPLNYLMCFAYSIVLSDPLIFGIKISLMTGGSYTVNSHL